MAAWLKTVRIMRLIALLLDDRTQVLYEADSGALLRRIDLK